MRQPMIRFKPRSIPSIPRAADQMVATVVTESRAAGDTVWMSWIADSISGWMLEGRSCVITCIRSSGLTAGMSWISVSRIMIKGAAERTIKKEAWAAYTVTSSLMKSL